MDRATRPEALVRFGPGLGFSLEHTLCIRTPISSFVASDPNALPLSDMQERPKHRDLCTNIAGQN
jgi:hypothetical protein